MCSRYLGTEIEYGITSPEDPTLSPILTSTQAVLAYAAAHEGSLDNRVRWDYAPESPLKDSRGFDLRRYHSAPIIDPNAIGAANLLLQNGARFYVDHAHPEYSAPETTSPYDAVVADRAGDQIMLEAAGRAETELKIYRNNVDGKGASYGAHENYLFRRDTEFADIVAGLTPFFVTRQVFAGAGRVGLGPTGQEAGFQISQRADYIETEVSLETTLNRGIINTRDEPHANADKWRRLHVIIGDANMSETATFLKLGTTSLVLDAIEDGVRFDDLALRDPVAAVQTVSRDLTCAEKLQLADHKTWLTAIEIQRTYLERVEKYDVEGDVVKRWREVLDLLEKDPLQTAHLLDWTAKLKLMRAIQTKSGISWDHPKLALIDIQYSDIDPARGLYHALVRRGAIQTIAKNEDVEHALAHAPKSTRAYLRGGVLRRFGNEVVAASWTSIIVDVEGEYHRISMLDLDNLDENHLRSAVEQSGSVGELIAGLQPLGIVEK